MSLVDVNAFLAPYGYQAVCSNPTLEAAFFDDLDPDDIAEFNNTAHTGSWQERLANSFRQSTDTYVVRSEDHPGTAIWGTTRIEEKIGRIWLLQTQTFAREAAAFLGPAYPHKMAGMARDAVTMSLRQYALVFNFIPQSRRQNIRFLKLAGFEFHPDPYTGSDWLFFGAGKNVELIGRDRTLWFSAMGKSDR